MRRRVNMTRKRRSTSEEAKSRRRIRTAIQKELIGWGAIPMIYGLKCFTMPFPAYNMHIFLVWQISHESWAFTAYFFPLILRDLPLSV